MNFYEQIFSRGRATGEGMTHFERLFAAKFGGSPPPEVREYTGAVPVTITADGTPLLDYLITGNTTQSGTPTPGNPITPKGCGVLEAGQYKIPISSANTTTPVYLGEVQSTRRIKKIVLDGTESWAIYSGFSAQNCYQFNTNITNHDENSEAISTHFTYTNVLRTLIDNDDTFMFSNIYNYIRVHISSCTSLEDFKSYLAAQYAAGTPVTVWYVLAEPETGIVNEPLMKIGDYADTLSKEQAGATIPTSNGSTTVDVDTTVKPSKVYIKYMG